MLLKSKSVLSLFEKWLVAINTPWWVWKNVLIYWAISLAFFPVLTGWCSVSVWRIILFPTAYEGLQNCMLCWS